MTSGMSNGCDKNPLEMCAGGNRRGENITFFCAVARLLSLRGIAAVVSGFLFFFMIDDLELVNPSAMKARLAALRRFL